MTEDGRDHWRPQVGDMVWTGAESRVRVSAVNLSDEQWDDPNLTGMARMYRDTFHDGPCRYDPDGECIGCGRVKGTERSTPRATVGAVYRQVADEHREAIELARRIVATPLEYGENRMALALVTIDEAMRSELTNDR